MKIQPAAPPGVRPFRLAVTFTRSFSAEALSVQYVKAKHPLARRLRPRRRLLDVGSNHWRFGQLGNERAFPDTDNAGSGMGRVDYRLRGLSSIQLGSCHRRLARGFPIRRSDHTCRSCTGGDNHAHGSAELNLVEGKPPSFPGSRLPARMVQSVGILGFCSRSKSETAFAAGQVWETRRRPASHMVCSNCNRHSRLTRPKIVPSRPGAYPSHRFLQPTVAVSHFSPKTFLYCRILNWDIEYFSCLGSG